MSYYEEKRRQASASDGLILRTSSAPLFAKRSMYTNLKHS